MRQENIQNMEQKLRVVIKEFMDFLEKYMDALQNKNKKMVLHIFNIIFFDLELRLLEVINKTDDEIINKFLQIHSHMQSIKGHVQNIEINTSDKSINAVQDLQSIMIKLDEFLRSTPIQFELQQGTCSLNFWFFRTSHKILEAMQYIDYQLKIISAASNKNIGL